MKKILILFLLFPFLSPVIYAYCKKPDCKCLTDKCRDQRKVLREKTGWSPDNEGILSEEKVEVSVWLICFYEIPFTKSKTYTFKMVTLDDTCREVFQIMYDDTAKLKAVVMKDEFSEGMEISHRLSFESKDNLVEYKKKKFGDVKLIHHKSLKHLK